MLASFSFLSFPITVSLQNVHLHLGWQIMLIGCTTLNSVILNFLTKFTDQLHRSKKSASHRVIKQNDSCMCVIIVIMPNAKCLDRLYVTYFHLCTDLYQIHQQCLEKNKMKISFMTIKLRVLDIKITFRYCCRLSKQILTRTPDTNYLMFLVYKYTSKS